jgi:hypothetical protein
LLNKAFPIIRIRIPKPDPDPAAELNANPDPQDCIEMQELPYI